MATKREIINDIRSVFPDAGLLLRSEVLRYIKRTKHHEAGFFDGLTTVPVGNHNMYLVVDIADRIYRSQT